MKDSKVHNYPFIDCVTITNQNVGKAPVLLRGDIEENIRQAKDLGYKAIELHLPNPQELNISQVAKACERNNMQVAGIATGSTYTVHKLSFTDDSEEIRNAAIQRVKTFADLASELSGILIIGCVRGNITDDNKSPVIHDRFRKSLQALSTYTETKKVPIVIEAINRYENNFLNTATETCEFIQSCQVPNLKALLDTFHMNIEEKNIENSILQHKDMIGYFHIADSNRMYPGGGHLDFESIFQALHLADYKGYVSVECNAIPDGNIAAEKSIKFLRQIY